MISRGVKKRAQKFVFYGVEGIGKTTFASKIPGVVFIDTEEGSDNLDVARFDKPTSFQMLLTEIQYAIDHSDELSALVIDTADWAEKMVIEHVCAKYKWQSIEDPGYGKGYTYVYEEFGKALNLLNQLLEKGVHVGFTAHAIMRKVELPDAFGQYDKWELKLSKKIAPMLKEWADIVLFFNYKTIVVKNGTGNNASSKGTGGKRVVYTSHNPCWDAKNRWGLQDEMDMEYALFGHIFEPLKQAPALTPAPTPVQQNMEQAVQKTQATQEAETIDYSECPAILLPLLKQDNVTPFELRAFVSDQGYTTMATPLNKYPADFVEGFIVAEWGKILQHILHNRANEPF